MCRYFHFDLFSRPVILTVHSLCTMYDKVVKVGPIYTNNRPVAYVFKQVTLPRLVLETRLMSKTRLESFPQCMDNFALLL